MTPCEYAGLYFSRKLVAHARAAELARHVAAAIVGSVGRGGAAE